MTAFRDRIWTIAFCASLLVHAALLLAASEVYVRTTAVWFAGFPRDMIAANVAPGDDQIISRFPEFGERDAIGYATNSSPGREELQAPRAPSDQALLSRDPIGPGKVGNEPSMSTLPEGGGIPADPGDATLQAAAPSPTVVAILPPVTEEASPFGPPASDELIGPGAPVTVATRPVAVALATVAPAPPVPPQPPVEAASTPMAAADAATPGAPVPPADPAPMSESESDAFTKTGGIEFRGGKMEARFGRAFKSVRPRLSLAAQLDLVGISRPRIVLKVAIDETGKVTSVDVLKSTGSDLVDQPVTVAMYKWWFEPATDANGKPAPDVIVFPISWH